MKKTKGFQAENILKFRNQLNLTQSALAELAKMSLKGIQNIEYGKTEGSRSLPRIAHALGVSVEDLLRDPKEKRPESKNFSLAEMNESKVKSIISETIAAVLEAQKKHEPETEIKNTAEDEIDEEDLTPAELQAKKDKLIRNISLLFPYLKLNDLRVIDEIASSAARAEPSFRKTKNF